MQHNETRKFCIDTSAAIQNLRVPRHRSAVHLFYLFCLSTLTGADHTAYEAAIIIGTRECYVNTLINKGFFTIAYEGKPRRIYLDEVVAYADKFKERKFRLEHPDLQLKPEKIVPEKSNWFQRANKCGTSTLKNALDKCGYILRMNDTNKKAKWQVIDKESKELVPGCEKPMTLKEIAKLMDQIFEVNKWYGKTPIDQRNINPEDEVFVTASAANKYGKAQGYDVDDETNGFHRCPSYYLVSQYGRMLNKKKFEWVTQSKQQVERVKKEDPDYYIKFFIRVEQDGKHEISFNAARLTALFFCANKKHKAQVHHIDIDPSNNYYKNLIWVTEAEHGELHTIYNSGNMAEYYAMIDRIRTDNGGRDYTWVPLDD